MEIVAFLLHTLDTCCVWDEFFKLNFVVVDVLTGWNFFFFIRGRNIEFFRVITLAGVVDDVTIRRNENVCCINFSYWMRTRC